MQLFRLKDNQFLEIKQQDIQLERDIQRTIEGNLQN